MKTVLVTGSEGFIGKNLIWTLKNKADVEILTYDINDSMELLEEYTKQADFIFHLAGVNRPQNKEEFYNGNKDFTEQILSLVNKSKKPVSILMSSSIQAALDNDYGISKRMGENLVFEWARNTGNKAYVFRLQNVFGKWCRPNYNSVVATFCHNIARELPVQINDGAAVLSLVYIDNVIEAFIQAFEGICITDNEGFCKVNTVFKITLQELADKLYLAFESRKSLVIPNFEKELDRYLYATYLSYLPTDNFGYELEKKSDNRGWLAEFVKSAQFGQIFISKTKPGITRGNHWHHTKVEKFLVIQGDAVISFRKIDSNEVIEYKVNGEQLKVLDIPVGYTHAIKNIGTDEVITLFWADEMFNQNKPDTSYLEV